MFGTEEDGSSSLKEVSADKVILRIKVFLLTPSSIESSQATFLPEVEGTLSNMSIINKVESLRKNQDSLEKSQNIAVNIIDVGAIPINRENIDKVKDTEDKETEENVGIGNSKEESTDNESMEENKRMSTSYFNEQHLEQQKVTTLQRKESS